MRRTTLIAATLAFIGFASIASKAEAATCQSGDSACIRDLVINSFNGNNSTGNMNALQNFKFPTGVNFGPSNMNLAGLLATFRFRFGNTLPKFNFSIGALNIFSFGKFLIIRIF